MTIGDIINSNVTRPVKNARPAAICELTNVTDLPRSGSAPRRFERRLFQYLLEQKKPLGIAKVFRFKNALLDGGLALEDGRFVLVEVKYRMNWAKACQAQWQFQGFVQSPIGRKYRSRHRIVFFEEFSGDWARASRQYQRGWTNWYLDHCGAPQAELRFDLVRFAEGRLETNEMS